MKRLLLLFLTVIVLFLCSWVNPDTVDVYTGYAYMVPSDLPVLNLGGNIKYYLSSYEGFGLSDDGYLINAGSSQRSGYLIAPNGGEYQCRFSVNNGLQIYQNYTTSGYERWAWVDYNLVPDLVPAAFTLPEFAMVLVTILVFILLSILIISRGAIL